MTTQQRKELLIEFKKNCDKDNDPYFVCHFSRQEDEFLGDWEGLDSFDAMILIKQLVKDLKIDKTLLLTAL